VATRQKWQEPKGLPQSASPSSEEKLLTDRQYNSGRRSKKYHKGGKDL